MRFFSICFRANRSYLQIVYYIFGFVFQFLNLPRSTFSTPNMRHMYRERTGVGRIPPKTALSATACLCDMNCILIFITFVLCLLLLFVLLFLGGINGHRAAPLSDNCLSAVHKSRQMDRQNSEDRPAMNRNWLSFQHSNVPELPAPPALRATRRENCMFVAL